MSNGNGDGWFYRALAPMALIFALGQLIIGMLWAGMISERVNHIAREHDEFAVRLSHGDAALSARLDQIDQHGTRALEIIQDRQKNVIERLNGLDARIGRNEAAIERIDRIRSVPQQ